MHSDSCIHLRDTYPHTSLDGSVKTIPYCCRCGMEWTEPMKRNMSRPIAAVHMKGHPSPIVFNLGMAGVWSWFTWNYITRLAALPHDDYAARWGLAWVALAFMAATFWNLALIGTYRARCERFHAAHALVMTALEDFELTPEQEQALTEARRG